MSKQATDRKPASCTLAEFQGNAKPLPVKIGDTLVGVAYPKTFSTGSYGFGMNGPTVFDLGNGITADCQLSLNITVKRSGPAKD